MVFEHTSVVAAPVGRLWDFMVDARSVSACLPGLEEFSEIDRDSYRGNVRLSLGPVSLRLSGTVAVLEREEAQARAVLRAHARDVRIPGEMSALFTAQLSSRGAEQTELHITTEAKILGKLGEFGQPVIRKTAERYISRFVDNIMKALGTWSDEAGAGPKEVAT